MRFVIAGAGGVGGTLGARLIEAGHRVAWVARGANLSALRKGIRLESPLGDLKLGRQEAADDPRKLGRVDAVVVAVKTYSLAELAPRLAPLAGTDSVRAAAAERHRRARRARRRAAATRVLKGMVSVKAHLAKPGAVVCDSGFCRMRFGGSGAQPLADAINKGKGLSAVVAPDIDADLWRKFVMLRQLLAVSCLTRAGYRARSSATPRPTAC